MGRLMRNCIQSLLKTVNIGIGMVGIAMIVYSLWMLRVWLRQLDSSQGPIPWFIGTLLGLGIVVCVITCSGNCAAESVNGCCLCIYISFLFLLIVLEVSIAADVFLNHSWEEDFPKDKTGNFDQLKEFIEKNFDVCKWIGITVAALQVLSIVLAMILKAQGPHPVRYYDSDEEYLPDRIPLLRNYIPPQAGGYGVADPRNDAGVVNSKSSRWN